jgi:hypothetical protein
MSNYLKNTLNKKIVKKKLLIISVTVFICTHFHIVCAQTRQGLFFTLEELTVWKVRSQQGPYLNKSDVSQYSPGDWSRILEKANEFVAKPSAERYLGPNASGCVLQESLPEPGIMGGKIKDAAFVGLVTGNTSYLNAVKTELLAQAAEPLTDFSNQSRWCSEPNGLNDANPGFQIAEWLTRLLMAYDYAKGTMSLADRQTLNRWFFNAARYFQENIDTDLNKLYVDRSNGNYTLTSYATNTEKNSPVFTTHYQGNLVGSLCRSYNNRRAAIIRFVGLAGIFLSNPGFQKSAKLFYKEWLMYATFPNGVVGEFHRWLPDYPETGLNYAFSVTGNMMDLADAFARNGDAELYKFSTAEGAYGTQGGNKNLLLVIKTLLNYLDGTVKRYATSDPAKNGTVNCLIDGIDTPANGSEAIVYDAWFAQANVYYKDPYVSSSYLRKGAGTRAYPMWPRGIGPNQPWSNIAAVHAGSLLMFGQMEGKIAPHANQAPIANAGPDQSIILPASSIVLKGSATDADGTISSYLWTQQGGPTATLSGTSSATLSVSNMVAGTYTFRLVVTDNKNATSIDEVTVLLYNQLPTVSVTSPSAGATFLTGANLTLTANAYDSEGVTKVEFFEGSRKLGQVLAAPYSFAWTNVVTGEYTLTAKVTDTRGAVTTSNPVNIVITCSATGTILREYWNNVTGTAVSAIPVSSIPSGSSSLTQLEAPADFGDNYGARIQGYLCPPQTGSYTFWIAGDNECELWLSSDETVSKKVRIANVVGSTQYREWGKQASQQSAGINLVAGRRYYVEVLHKESFGGDHVSVGWQLPSGTMERPIPGNRLSPYIASNRPPTVNMTAPTAETVYVSGGTVALSASASDFDGTVSKVEFFQTIAGGNPVKIGEVLNQPFSINWTAGAAGIYSLTAKATDNGGASTTSAGVSVTVWTNCSSTGTILREYWSNVTGTAVSAIPVSSIPSGSSSLTQLEAPANVGDNYGARIQGYLCPPLTGSYTFWIAGDNDCELWLSSDETVSKKVRIANVVGSTQYREWGKQASQQSAGINLVAGRRYYVEVLHKEAFGGDHVSVGWQLPSGTMERPIPGNRLSPFNKTSSNVLPSVQVLTPSNGDAFPTGGSFTITASAFDSDGSIERVEFFRNNVSLGISQTEPYSVVWSNVAAGNYNITAVATDNQGVSVTSAVVKVSVGAAVSCGATGTILREVWTNVEGPNVEQIPTNTPPFSSSQAVLFEAPSNVGDNYGQRMRGYVCPPTSGNYVFWIASDNDGELWISSNDNPANKQLIAFVKGGYATRQEWTKYASQQSVPIPLQAGQRYYIEALHKEAYGGDNLAVGWQLPSGTMERPIPGNRLSPFQSASNARTEVVAAESRLQLQVYPNPFSDQVSIEYTIPKAETVELQLYDLRGGLVKSLYRGLVEAGTLQKQLLRADGITDGIYLLRLTTAKEVVHTKVMLAR